MRLLAIPVFVSALGVLASSLSAAVIVVDPQGQPGGPILQAAINAAASGDILIVRDGTYTQVAPIAISGKGITIVEDAAGTVVLRGLAIQQVPAGAALTVRGFQVDAPPPFLVPSPAVAVTNCPGTVWLEECNVNGWQPAAGASGGGGPALNADGAAGLVLERCMIRGGDAGFAPSANLVASGADGATFTGSQVVAHGCVFEGGATSFSFALAPAVNGGHAVRLVAGMPSVLLAGCDLTGGDKNVALSFGGAAGSGLVVTSGSVRRRDCSIVAGMSVDGQVAPDVQAPSGAVTSYPAPAGSLTVATPVVSGFPATITYQGTSGDLVALFLSPGSGQPLAVVPAQGSWVLGSPVAGPFLLGSVPASGTLATSIPTAPLPAATPDALGFAIQAVVLQPGTTLESAALYVQMRPGL